MLFRLWSKSRGIYRSSWDDTHSGFWDDAVRGSSALQAALRRNISNEISSHLGHHNITTLWDIEKFYDSIDIVELLKLARNMNYPSLLLALVVQLYLCPRILVVNNCYHTGIVPYNAVLAGCAQAATFSKILLFDILEYAHNYCAQAQGLLGVPNCDVFPQSAPRSYIDDIAQCTHFLREDRTLEQAANVAVMLHNMLRRRKLKLAAKSVILSSSVALKNKMCRWLKAEGITVKPAMTARDLGIENNVTKKRANNLVRQRINKAITRLRRIKQLVRTNKIATKLVPTGALPQALWGASSVGWPISIIDTFTKGVGSAVGVGGKSCCLMFQITVVLGVWGHPHIKYIGNLIDDWVRLWLKPGVERSDIYIYI